MKPRSAVEVCHDKQTITELRTALATAIEECKAQRNHRLVMNGCGSCPPENECHEDCRRLVAEAIIELDDARAATDDNALCRAELEKP